MATSIIPALNTAYRGRTTIPDGTDLNSVIEHGFYNLNASYTYGNMPSTKCYQLFVSRIGTGTTGLQLAFQHARIFIRFRSGETAWSDWHVFGADWAVRRPEIVIPANSDFDDYTTPGSYRVASGDDMATMENVPFSSMPCRLDVFQTAGDTANYVKQVCWAYSAENIYIRTKFSSRWTDWTSLLYPYRYREGTMSTTSFGCFGWVTTSSTQLTLYIPCVTKVTSSINTISSAIINVRIPTGGYLISNGFDIAPYITSKSVTAQGIYLVAVKSDGWGVTNNIPVTGAIALTGELGA